MMLKFSCQHCGGMLQIDSQYSGQQTRCPHCKNVMVVPAPNSAGRQPPPQRTNPPAQPPPLELAPIKLEIAEPPSRHRRERSPEPRRRDRPRPPRKEDRDELLDYHFSIFRLIAMLLLFFTLGAMTVYEAWGFLTFSGASLEGMSIEKQAAVMWVTMWSTSYPYITFAWAKVACELVTIPLILMALSTSIFRQAWFRQGLFLVLCSLLVLQFITIGWLVTHPLTEGIPKTSLGAMEIRAADGAPMYLAFVPHRFTFYLAAGAGVVGFVIVFALGGSFWKSRGFEEDDE